MSLAEIVDRYGILKLKMESIDEYLSPDQLKIEKPLLEKELALYDRAIENFRQKGIDIQEKCVEGLYSANAKCKEMESNIRRNIGKISSLTSKELEEVGKSVIKLRGFNEERMVLKNEISSKSRVTSDIIRMPLGEVIDRYTILKLKTERIDKLTPDQILYEKPNLERELKSFSEAIDKFRQEGFEVEDRWIKELYQINAKCWDIESDIRRSREKSMGLEEVGRTAMILRQFAQNRIDLKNEIAAKSKTGFKEVKIYFK